jgi:aryl-alcohol dehydrogenase-like predicted oxidoreductase
VQRLDRVRDLLTTGGRTLVQGSLGYLWELDLSVPGVRTPAQAAENVQALTFGPLPAETAAAVTELLADSPERADAMAG